jgi:MYXO-CTERM domain-containing protein
VCDAKVCKDGCRGTGGNGCPSGKVCSSTSNAVGTCQNPPADAGPDAAPDAAVPPVDAAVPPVDAAVPPVDAAAPVDFRNDNGSLEGGGVSCSAGRAGGEGASGAFAALGLVGLALVARGRRRAK